MECGLSEGLWTLNRSVSCWSYKSFLSTELNIEAEKADKKQQLCCQKGFLVMNKSRLRLLGWDLGRRHSQALFLHLTPSTIELYTEWYKVLYWTVIGSGSKERCQPVPTAVQGTGRRRCSFINQKDMPQRAVQRRPGVSILLGACNPGILVVH